MLLFLILSYHIDTLLLLKLLPKLLLPKIVYLTSPPKVMVI
jgi:hypothetical protein